MMTLYPTIIVSALNLGAYASTFINMMESTMDDPDSDNNTPNALLCMIGLGAGEIIGSMVFGRITDKMSYKQTIMINVVSLAVGGAFLILYASVYNFSFPLAIAMTITWGF